MNEVESPERESRRVVQRHLEPILIRPARNLLNHRAEKVVGGVDLDVERQRPALQPRDLEQVGDETIEPVGLLLDDERALVAEWLQLVSERLDRCQRSSQIVRERGKQGVLQFVGFPQRLRALDCGALRSRAVEELRGHDTRDEEDEKHEPIERISHEQRVVRRQEKPIEGQERDECGSYSEKPSSPQRSRREQSAETRAPHALHSGGDEPQKRERDGSEGHECHGPDRSARPQRPTAFTEARQSGIRRPAQ